MSANLTSMQASLDASVAGPTASKIEGTAPRCATTGGHLFPSGSVASGTESASPADQPRPESGVASIRSDYRRQVWISEAEAADLTGYARKTIRNALCSGRLKRGGVGRFCIDQASVLAAFDGRRK